MTSLLVLVGFVGVVFGTRAAWIAALSDDQTDATDLYYRVTNAARPPGMPNLPVPITPGYVAVPLATAVVGVGIAVVWLGFSTIRESPAQALTLVVPMEIGALAAVRLLRRRFVTQWNERRRDPEDRITREFGRVRHDVV